MERMNHKQKVQTLKERNIARWINTVSKATDIIDSRYPMFCPCGKLATGLHTSHCSKYIKMVELEAIRIIEIEDKEIRRRLS